MRQKLAVPLKSIILLCLLSMVVPYNLTMSYSQQKETDIQFCFSLDENESEISNVWLHRAMNCGRLCFFYGITKTAGHEIFYVSPKIIASKFTKNLHNNLLTYKPHFWICAKLKLFCSGVDHKWRSLKNLIFNPTQNFLEYESVI